MSGVIISLYCVVFLIAFGVSLSIFTVSNAVFVVPFEEIDPSHL